MKITYKDIWILLMRHFAKLIKEIDSSTNFGKQLIRVYEETLIEMQRLEQHITETSESGWRQAADEWREECLLHRTFQIELKAKMDKLKADIGE